MEPVKIVAAAALMAFAIIGIPATAQEPVAAPQSAKGADPNERICEDVQLIGSRIAKRRFCGTRAEWEERRKQDREVVERAQTQIVGPCQTINTHTGPASC